MRFLLGNSDVIASERSERSNLCGSIDCFVAALLAMTLSSFILVNFAYADFGPTQTKRDRLKRELKESGGRRVLTTADYEQIHESFLKEDYAAVDGLAGQYLSDGLNRPNADDVLYLQALSLLKLHRSDQARQKLSQLENSFVAYDRKASASASIGDSYFYDGNSAAAYQAYGETLRKYPASDQTAYVLGKLLELSMQQGRFKEAEFYKARLLREFPESQEAKEAADRFIGPARNVQSVPSSFGKYSTEESRVFAVQVGSFSKQKNARALANKLIYRNFDAYLQKDGSERMYRVRVGRMGSKEEAMALADRLKREGYPTKIYP